MRQLTFTSDPNQNQIVTLEDGSKVGITMTYSQQQQGWFYSIVYGATLIDYNRRLVVSPNMLRQFSGIIPFGIACVSTDGYEPLYVDDFSTGRVVIYTLNSSDVAVAEQVIAQ